MPPQRHLLNYLKEGWRSIKQANKEELFEKGKINKYPLQKPMQYYLNDWRLLRRTSEFHNFITSKHIHTMTKKTNNMIGIHYSVVFQICNYDNEF